MDKRGHVLNAALLSVGIGLLLYPSLEERTVLTVVEVALPIVLGALFPDVDTAFGRHRKTFHNLPVLAIFLAFPYYFGNLRYVWIGVLTHYVLDVVGSRRGIAFFYPLADEEWGFPSGVTTSSKWATAVTVVVTLIELGTVAAVIYLLPQVDLEYTRQLLGL
ncbi:hypothetical protein BRD00_09360 [Halobacteriales archaeon QS_8_69_26]|nr:MAG: hypothetical protein BRD00_09360 [Halobacteriales archaeon QS_8_69_26]